MRDELLRGAASRLNVSTPTPQISRSSTRKRAACSLNPGACIVPFASRFRNRSVVVARASQPECIATSAPAGMRPCCFSHSSEIVDRDERVGIFRGTVGDVDDHQRRDQAIDGKAIARHRAGDEMRRRVDVRAGVLVERHLVVRESVLCDRRSRAYLYGLVPGIHRQATAKTDASNQRRRETHPAAGTAFCCAAAGIDADTAHAAIAPIKPRRDKSRRNGFNDDWCAHGKLLTLRNFRSLFVP